MNVEINWVGVGVATLASMIVGSFWYARGVFGASWMKLVKLDEKKAKAAMPMTMLVAVITSFLTAYILAHITYLSFVFFEVSFTSAALTTAFWLWLGLVAARFIVHDAFEQRDMKLTAMNIGNELVTLLAMGLAIGWIGL